MKYACWSGVIFATVTTFAAAGRSDEAGTPSSSAVSPSVLAQSDGGLGMTASSLLRYRFEHPDLSYKDVVTLKNRSRSLGKVMEWADQILVFDGAGGMRAHSTRDVEMIDLRRTARHTHKSELPDLTVAYVERLPRDLSWHGHVTMRDGIQSLDVDPRGASESPKPGSDVTYRVHVLNAGSSESTAVRARMELDGKPLGGDASIPALKPGAEHVFEAKWVWAEGDHAFTVAIDPDAVGRESLRWNNRLTQPTGAAAVSIVVARDRYEAFKNTPNLCDSYCFEDFVQYHMACLNGLFAASAYPSSPEGALERVACDRIVVVEDPDDAARRGSWESGLHQGGAAGGLCEYSALLTYGRLAADENVSREALMVDWVRLKAIGRQLGLVDLARTDTTVSQCNVLDRYERFAMIQYLSPWRASLMHTPGGFPLTEEQAAYLNRARGRPRGFSGEYLYQLPKKVSVKVLGTDRSPLRDVQVDLFQVMADGPDAGKIMGIGRTDPIVASVTNEFGIAELVNLEVPDGMTPNGFPVRSNPFGRIAPDGGNGLLLLRLRWLDGNEEFNFLPISELNVAFLRGQQDEFIRVYPTRFASPAATVPNPPFAAVEFWERDRHPSPLVVTWMPPKDIDPTRIEEYRVYKRTGFAGQQVKPWTLVSVHRPPEMKNFPHGIETYFDEFNYDGPYSLDTYFAVSTVDSEGHESGLSEPGYIPYQTSALRFAIDRRHGFMTVRGEGASQMLYWDGRAGTQPHRMNYGGIPGYVPGFEGVAFTLEGNLIVTDPANHVLAVYDSNEHELLNVFPRRETWPGRPSDAPGEFDDPADIAVDDGGVMYVAERGNSRVQMLGPRFEPRGLLDPDFRFQSPTAVCHSNGHICVTDKWGTRCRVYDVSKGEPKFVLELPALYDADRAVINDVGRVFVTGRQERDSPWTVLSFDPDNAGSAVYSGAGVQGEMGTYEKPRSMYQHRGDPLYVYMINEFPFDVRRVHLRQQ